jgi:hypothetical protein
MQDQQSVKKNLLTVKTQIREYEQLFSRKPNSVFLLAVSKGQPLEKIQQAIEAGQIAFGENYLQEALVKIEALKNKNIEWHFIGTIQSNKTKKIARHFSWVHSVSNLVVAKSLSEQRLSELPPLNICIEVNVSKEKSKSGAVLDDLLVLAKNIQNLPRLRLRGLMMIPAPVHSFDEQRAIFRILKNEFELLNSNGFNLDTLSMGMSADMEAAIAEESTLVRIGTGIFGKRSNLK